MVDEQCRRGFFRDGFCMDDSLLFFFLLLVILFCSCGGFGRC